MDNTLADGHVQIRGVILTAEDVTDKVIIYRGVEFDGSQVTYGYGGLLLAPWKDNDSLKWWIDGD